VLLEQLALTHGINLNQISGYQPTGGSQSINAIKNMIVIQNA